MSGKFRNQTGKDSALWASGKLFAMIVRGQSFLVTREGVKGSETQGIDPNNPVALPIPKPYTEGSPVARRQRCVELRTV